MSELLAEFFLAFCFLYANAACWYGSDVALGLIGVAYGPPWVLTSTACALKLVTVVVRNSRCRAGL